MVPQFRFSPAAQPPLRIGIMLDSSKPSGFFAQVIEDIQASNFAKIELLVYRKKSSAPKPPNSRLANWTERLLDSNKRKRLFYEMYQRFDQPNQGANHPLTSVDCTERLAGIERIEVEPIGKKFVHRFPDDALQQIRAKNLDVLLRFGFNILHGDILKAARYGVWSYHHGDNDFYRGGPALFWELPEHSPLSGVLLQVLTEELDGGLVLCKSLFSTERTLSLAKNRYVPYWGSTDMVIRKLNELHQFGWEHVRQRSVPAAPYQGKRQIYRTPTNLEMLRWLGPAAMKKAASRVFQNQKKTVQHWRIGIRMKAAQPLGSAADHHMHMQDFRWIEPPPGHFWADPFAIELDGKYWAYFEDYSYQTSVGRIACAEIAADDLRLHGAAGHDEHVPGELRRDAAGLRPGIEPCRRNRTRSRVLARLPQAFRRAVRAVPGRLRIDSESGALPHHPAGLRVGDLGEGGVRRHPRDSADRVVDDRRGGDDPAGIAEARASAGARTPGHAAHDPLPRRAAGSDDRAAGRLLADFDRHDSRRDVRVPARARLSADERHRAA